MNLISYLKDKVTSLIISFLSVLLIETLLIIFDVNMFLKVYIPIILVLIYLFIFLYNYFRKKDFYNNILKSLNSLDQKYLIAEIIDKPSFLEGKMLSDILYETDKSMIENVNNYKISSNEFREYLEMWCHEIKTPIATSKLIIENNKNKSTNSILEEQEKIEKLIEQVLFYARSNSLEKDYIVKKVNLKNIVQEVIKKHKKDIIYKNIKIDIKGLNLDVNSDSKWLIFIIEQVFSNSIKYSKDDNAVIKVSTKKNQNNIMLFIEDNGIGIKKEELDNVFEKGFTGSNGRLKYNSTGIGLYLCKKLCNKLNHNITINSTLNEKTLVTIIFPDSSLTSVIKK